VTFAFDNHFARLASGIYCSCGRQLKASDVEIIGADVLLICQGCHRDILTIERETSR
jgi:hypothetical protein